MPVQKKTPIEHKVPLMRSRFTRFMTFGEGLVCSEAVDDLELLTMITNKSTYMRGDSVVVSLDLHLYADVDLCVYGNDKLLEKISNPKKGIVTLKFVIPKELHYQFKVFELLIVVHNEVKELAAGMIKLDLFSLESPEAVTVG